MKKCPADEHDYTAQLHNVWCLKRPTGDCHPFCRIKLFSMDYYRLQSDDISSDYVEYSSEMILNNGREIHREDDNKIEGSSFKPEIDKEAESIKDSEKYDTESGTANTDSGKTSNKEANIDDEGINTATEDEDEDASSDGGVPLP